PEIPRAKIAELPWGANVERFAPTKDVRARYIVPLRPSSDSRETVVFLGSFRAWHGVLDFVQAAALLLARGYDYRFLLIGVGPDRAAAERLAAAWPGHFEFTGEVAYDDVPALVARASLRVAPFNAAPHPAAR